MGLEDPTTSLGTCFLRQVPCSESCQAFNIHALDDPTENACTIVQGFKEMSIFTAALAEVMVPSALDEELE